MDGLEFPLGRRKFCTRRHRIPLKNRSIISCKSTRFIIANESQLLFQLRNASRCTRGGFSIRHTLNLLFDKLLSSQWWCFFPHPPPPSSFGLPPPHRALLWPIWTSITIAALFSRLFSVRRKLQVPRLLRPFKGIEHYTTPRWTHMFIIFNYFISFLFVKLLFSSCPSVRGLGEGEFSI